MLVVGNILNFSLKAHRGVSRETCWCRVALFAESAAAAAAMVINKPISSLCYLSSSSAEGTNGCAASSYAVDISRGKTGRNTTHASYIPHELINGRNNYHETLVNSKFIIS